MALLRQSDIVRCAFVGAVLGILVYALTKQWWAGLMMTSAATALSYHFRETLDTIPRALAATNASFHRFCLDSAKSVQGGVNSFRRWCDKMDHPFFASWFFLWAVGTVFVAFFLLTHPPGGMAIQMSEQVFKLAFADAALAALLGMVLAVPVQLLFALVVLGGAEMNGMCWDGAVKNRPKGTVWVSPTYRNIYFFALDAAVAGFIWVLLILPRLVIEGGVMFLVNFLLFLPSRSVRLSMAAWGALGFAAVWLVFMDGDTPTKLAGYAILTGTTTSMIGLAHHAFAAWLALSGWSWRPAAEETAVY
ncbi:MAG: hypothetical protein HYT39_04135 [Candidatus Sungbacteria bacterium]|nr:hypothetical protein [Candidatus Sungbacteria bacterium]